MLGVVKGKGGEAILLVNGILAAGVGVFLAMRDAEGLLAATCIVLGFALFLSAISKRIGLLLTLISLILFVTAVLV